MIGSFPERENPSVTALPRHLPFQGRLYGGKPSPYNGVFNEVLL